MMLNVALVLTAVAAFLSGCAEKKPADSSEFPEESPVSEDERDIGNASEATCTRNIGMYSWDQRSWRNPEQSELLRFLASGTLCGDVYVNVADYSNARELKDERMLLEFVRRARRLRTLGVVYLTYGDVTEKDEVAVEIFVETIFRWFSRISKAELKRLAPIGISFDIEHFPTRTFERVLKKAQRKKRELGLGEGDFLVQATIEGAYKPLDTDVIMQHADRALMMVYRNHLGNEEENDLLGRLAWFLREQCEKCLDDDYATKKYKAKLAVMVETACRVGNSCKQISFCAKTGRDAGDSVHYLFDTLKELDARMVSSGLLTQDQKRRLFAPSGIANESAFVAHHFEWFQCFFRKPEFASSSGLCGSFDVWADTCRSQ